MLSRPRPLKNGAGPAENLILKNSRLFISWRLSPRVFQVLANPSQHLMPVLHCRAAPPASPHDIPNTHSLYPAARWMERGAWFSTQELLGLSPEGCAGRGQCAGMLTRQTQARPQGRMWSPSSLSINWLWTEHWSCQGSWWHDVVVSTECLLRVCGLRMLAILPSPWPLSFFALPSFHFHFHVLSPSAPLFWPLFYCLDNE